MKLVSIDSTGLYTYEYNKNEINKIAKKLRKNNINYYIEKKYNQITIIK